MQPWNRNVFCHLHTHSNFSFLEGIPSPAALASAAAAYRMPALALTDHLSLTGSIVFYRACLDAGIRPILGIEIDMSLPYQLQAFSRGGNTGKLVLLAENQDGWRSLCRTSSRLLANAQTGTSPICDINLLQQHADGLVCMTGGCRGTVQYLVANQDGNADAFQFLGRLAEIFPNRLYVELHQQVSQDTELNKRILGLARQCRLPVAASHNVYYLEPGQASIQRTVAAVREIVPLDRLSDESAAPGDASFLPPNEMEQRFAHFPEALSGNAEIVERCRCTLDLKSQHYPTIQLPEGISALQLLKSKAESGARRLYGTISEEIQQRLDRELAVIADRGYEPIFLIAEEMISFARENDIPFASRGSASSSLVAHSIGITSPDPLAHNLYFERFLNPARTTPPDIDTDLCSNRRDEVIRHLFETYGQDRVAMVGTVNTYRPRSALGDVAKAHGFSPQEVHALTSQLFHRYWMREDLNQTANPPVNPYTELIQKFGESQRYEVVFREASELLGMPHHLSVHAGGVVIAPGPIADFVPVARSGGKGVIITQFDLDDVEHCGLIKLDLLGIRGLSVMGDVARSIYSWRRKEFRTAMDVLEAIPLDDSETAALVSTGRTIGCFQIESPGMRTTLKDIQARTPDDILAALALYRPGPLKGGLRDAFVRRHNHQEQVTHIHPALSSLLEETYGVILYQEQVLRIAHELAGLTLAESDLLRRAMSHFDPGKQIQVLKERFVDGAAQRSAVPADTAARIWEMMAAFAGYGFPKAHAASYAQVAWRSAWCKAHYPAEFIAAVLANWGGYYPQSVYLSEARRLNVPVRPPHINHSVRQFSVAYPHGQSVLYMGLDQVRDLTRRTQERILRLRPFTSLADFLARVDPRRQEVENLVQCGAMDGMGAIPALLYELKTGKKRPGQLSLFPIDSPGQEDWTRQEKNAAQARLLGASLEAHPLELFAGEIRQAGAVTTMEAASRIGEKVRVAGMRQTLFRSKSSTSAWRGFLVIEDLEGMLDVILLPGVYQRARSVISSTMEILVVEGVMERDTGTGEPVLRAESISKLM